MIAAELENYIKSGFSETVHKIELKSEEILGPLKQGSDSLAIERGRCAFFDKENKKIDEYKLVFDLLFIIFCKRF